MTGGKAGRREGSHAWARCGVKLRRKGRRIEGNREGELCCYAAGVLGSWEVGWKLGAEPPEIIGCVVQDTCVYKGKGSQV